MTLDFTILKDLNPTRILFLDTHTKSPVSPTLHIKFPDFKKEYSTPIQYGEINILNTQRMGYTDSIIEFQDGTYEFTFEINNKSCIEKKKIFITTQAYSKLNEALKNFDYTNKDLLEKFNKINLYLQASEAVVCINSQQAEALYKQADNLLKCF